MIKDFDSFWKALTENQIWFETLKYNYGRKDIKGVGKKFFIDLLAQPNEIKTLNWEKWRRQFQKWLIYEPDMPTSPHVPSVKDSEPKELKPEDMPLTGEARRKKLQEYKDLILATPPLKPVPKMSRKEYEELGGWEPKKADPYPTTTPAQLRKLELHIQYLRENYDPVTGDKRDCWMEEPLWLELNK